MKKILIIFSFLFIFSSFLILGSRELDREKLKDFLSMDLEFINYRGPYDFINTYEQIVGIGDFLARGLKESGNNTANFYNKYLINRYIDNKDLKVSADVFTIKDRSGLDSILNLRRILSGYLMKAFDYDRSSAELLAKIITIYNAVYRGDIDYYVNTYIEPSVRFSNKENIGLSRVYSQWAGKTQIFIPLKRDVLSENVKSEVDLDQLVSKKVISSLLNENEGGIDSARSITDLQEESQEIDQSKIDFELDKFKENEANVNKKIEDLRKHLETVTDETQRQNLQKQLDDINSKKVLNENKAKIDEAQKKVDYFEKKLDTQRKVIKGKIQEKIDSENNKNKNFPSSGEINSSKRNKKAQKKVEKLDESSSINLKEKDKKRISQLSSNIDLENTASFGGKNKQNNNISKTQTQPQELEGSLNNQKITNFQFPNKMTEESRSLSSIKGDKNALPSPSLSLSYQDKVLFLEVLDPSANLAVLQLLDSSGVGLKKNNQSKIKRYGVYERDKDLVAIKVEGESAKLQILDKLNFEVKSESKLEVSKDSSIFVDYRMILVVVKYNNKFKLARFSINDLDTFILSETEVLPFTSFTVKDNIVFLQDLNRKIISFDLNTLKQVER